MKYPLCSASITVRPVSGLIILESRFFIPQSTTVSAQTVLRRQRDITVSPFVWVWDSNQANRASNVVVKFSPSHVRVASRTRYLNWRSEATKSLYRHRATNLANELAVDERLVDDPTRLAIL